MTISHLSAYWGARAESVDQAAEKVARLLAALADVDPVLTGWRDQALSKKKALAEPVVTANHDELVDRLLAGRIRRHDNGETLDDFGYSLSWWNARDNEDATAVLTIRTGITSSKMLNSVTIRLPDSAAAPGIYTKVNATHLMSTLIAIFRPDRAHWLSRDVENLQKEPNRPLADGSVAIGTIIGHAAGWATYLRDGEGNGLNPALVPGTATFERIDDGTLVTLGDDPANPPLDDVLAVRAAMGYTVPPRDEEAAAAVDAAPAASASGAPVAEHQERPRRDIGEGAKSADEASPRPKDQ